MVLWCILVSIFDIAEYFDRQTLPDEEIQPFSPHGNVQTFKKWNFMFTLPLIASVLAVLLLILRGFEKTKPYQALLAMLIILFLEAYVAQLISYHMEMVENDTPELDFPDKAEHIWRLDMAAISFSIIAMVEGFFIFLQILAEFQRQEAKSCLMKITCIA